MTTVERRRCGVDVRRRENPIPSDVGRSVGRKADRCLPGHPQAPSRISARPETVAVAPWSPEHAAPAMSVRQSSANDPNIDGLQRPTAVTVLDLHPDRPPLGRSVPCFAVPYCRTSNVSLYLPQQHWWPRPPQFYTVHAVIKNFDSRFSRFDAIP